MTEIQIKEYRSLIETQLKDKEADIETTITYVTLGLLGLFLTINEKFIPLITSINKWILLISICAFVISFILGLYNKFNTTKFDREIIDLLDSLELKKEEDENILLDKWKKCDSSLQNIRKLIYCFLIIGLITQLVYFFTNLNIETTKDKSIKIEIKYSNIDTIMKLENTNIHIYNAKELKK